MNIKKLLFVICITLFIASCNNKKEDGKPEQLTENSSDCNCSELNLADAKIKSSTLDDGSSDEVWKDVLKDGNPYSGVCIEKDQNDSIVKSIEFKNGWTVHKIVREKVRASYITLSDMIYDNLNERNGFRILIESDENLKYVRQLDVIKNGNLDTESSYKIWIKDNDVIPINKRWDDFTEMFIWDKANGLSIRSTFNLGTCIKDLKYANNEESADDEKIYYIENPTPQQKEALFECLKKQLPKFNYSNQR